MSERDNPVVSTVLDSGDASGFKSPLAPSLIAAAHELKAPLSLIRQLALTLEEADTLGLPPLEKDRLIRRIVLSTERSLRLTDALTRQSRLEDGLFELRPLNLVQIAEEVAHELMPLARESGRELRVARAQVPLALANEDLVRQVAFNLCENAIVYSHEHHPVTLKLSGLDHGDRVRLGVRDDGPKGFDGALAKLARNLGKAPADFGPRPNSSGLGLYVATKCAQAMNGSLGLIRHTRGSTFYLDLNASRQMDFFRV